MKGLTDSGLPVRGLELSKSTRCETHYRDMQCAIHTVVLNVVLATCHEARPGEG